MIRTRWAAFGAAIAVAIGAGGGVSLTNAALNSGARSVFVSVSPCRLFDTRPTSQVGPRSAPLAAGDVHTQQVTGDNGECTGIPSDATAVSLNVTIAGPTADSHLTVYPADLSQPPNASNLNWRAGGSAVPNKVDVRLSPTGAIKLFNAFGNVHVLADVVGYYQGHTHDDRYYTKTESDAQLSSKASTSSVDAALASKSNVIQVFSAANSGAPSPLQVQREYGNFGFTTTQAGYLEVSATVTGAWGCGVGTDDRWWFIAVDGVPVPSSAVETNNTSSFDGRLYGVTAAPVAAGAHSLSIGAMCESSAIGSGGWSGGTAFSVILLPT